MLGMTVGWIWFGLIIVVFIGAYFWHRAERKKARRAKLLSKYGDDKIVEKIMNRYFWQGQTAEQLRDSLGNPVEYDRKVLKAGKREVWKYKPAGKNRFDLRITLENDLVVEWDKRHSA